MKNYKAIEDALNKAEVMNKAEAHNIYKLNIDHEIEFLLTHLIKNKNIDKADISSIDQVLLDAVMNGLTLNPSLNYAHVAFRNIDNKLVPVYDIGYQGMISQLKLLANIVDVYAHVVFENDIFTGCQGLNPNLDHQPYYFIRKTREERGRPWGVYAVVVFSDGYRKFNFLSAERVHEIRLMSSDYKEDIRNSTNLSAWLNSNWEEMWCKTAIKHIYKTIPKSHTGTDLQAAVRITQVFESDNDANGIEIDKIPHPPASSADEKIIDTIEKAAASAILKGKIEPQEDTPETSAALLQEICEAPPYIARAALRKMYTTKTAKKELEVYANKLGILQEIINNHTGKRLSKKIVYEGILKHYDEYNIDIPKNGQPEEKPMYFEGGPGVQIEPLTDGNYNISVEPKPIKEDEAFILNAATQLKNSIREKGMKSFIKAASQILDHLACPSQDPEKIRSVTGCNVLYEFITFYEVEEELEELLDGDPFDFIAKASNDELRAALQSF